MMRNIEFLRFPQQTNEDCLSLASRTDGVENGSGSLDLGMDV